MQKSIEAEKITKNVPTNNTIKLYFIIKNKPDILVIEIIEIEKRF